MADNSENHNGKDHGNTSPSTAVAGAAAVANDTATGPVVSDHVATEYKCANCGNSTAQRCGGCAEGTDDHGNASPTYYCSAECQSDHWKLGHKLQCRLAIDRRQLFKIGSLVQWAFYASSKAIWYDGIAEVKKIKHTEGDDGAELLLERYKKHDGVNFPAFPKDVFQEERDEQAVLATSASNGAIVCLLLDDLVQEVTVDPKAPHSVRFAPLDISASNKSLIYWIFRVTLRDGSVFAFDPCNAQYSCTTIQERKCGVFPWESYLSRLSVTSLIEVQGFLFNAPKGEVYPVGNIKDGKANVFLDADIRSTAEWMASSFFTCVSAGLQFKANRSLGQLMARSSSHQEFAANAQLFKNMIAKLLHDGSATANGMMGIKDMVLERLYHKAA